MGMKNVLALTGDFSGKGFGGRGTPVFDFDSSILISMLNDLNRRLIKTGHTTMFQVGCAVSPFKYTEAESWIQYKKLGKKIDAGSSFVITQLGYDVDKYEELLRYNRTIVITSYSIHYTKLYETQMALLLGRCNRACR